MQSISHAWRVLTSRSADLSAKLGRNGAVAIVTAIMAPVLVLVVGFAADYGYSSYINQRLSRASDSATLGSVSQTAATTAGGYSQTAALQAIGVSMFNANVADLPSTGVNYNLSVVSDGSGGIIATGSYTYNNPTFFGGILGFNTIPLSGTAKTVARPVVYLNYYILIDNSQSMGIGATQADMTALYQRVLSNNNASSADGGCVFGCHVPSRIAVASNGSYIYSQYTNEDLAHNLTRNYGAPITLRIDSAVAALNGIVSSAAQIAATTKNIQFGIYTIQVDPNTGTRISPVAPAKNPPAKQPDYTLSSDYNAVKSVTSQVALGNTIGYQNTGDSNFHDEFADFVTYAGPKSQGSGASATSPLNYIFLITDGMNDIPGSCQPYGICTAPINANDCSTLKTNATVGVIYTTYLPIYQNNTPPTLETRYRNLVDGKPPLIRSALQSCATSSDWYFEAQDGPSIVSSMQALFERTQPTSARITQ